MKKRFAIFFFLTLAWAGAQAEIHRWVDKDGNMVAYTKTINHFFGSGITAPGTGVLLNNEMDDFSAKPGVANAYGLIGPQPFDEPVWLIGRIGEIACAFDG